LPKRRQAKSPQAWYLRRRDGEPKEGPPRVPIVGGFLLNALFDPNPQQEARIDGGCPVLFFSD
jgi:hypothetical protein